MKIVNAFIEPVIQKALSRKKNNAPLNTDSVDASSRARADEEKEIGEDETMLDHLVKATDDPVILRDVT